MGSDDAPHPEDGEGPERKVWVDSFSISSIAVTNENYLNFVINTGYQTVAENIGHSFVFLNQHPDIGIDRSLNSNAFWKLVNGASWKSPEGIGSSIDTRYNHPVVHLSNTDILAYCEWTQTRLPTEAEWEFAARGGLTQKDFPWGNNLKINGNLQANTWQGEVPPRNAKNKFVNGTMPVDSFQPNFFGLFNMTGNVWERVSDKFTNLHSPRPVRNPSGPINGVEFVAKGGSFLCHSSYCARYRTSSRQSLKPDITSSNIGLRVAKL